MPTPSSETQTHPRLSNVVSGHPPNRASNLSCMSTVFFCSPVLLANTSSLSGLYPDSLAAAIVPVLSTHKTRAGLGFPTIFDVLCWRMIMLIYSVWDNLLLYSPQISLAHPKTSAHPPHSILNGAQMLIVHSSILAFTSNLLISILPSYASAFTRQQSSSEQPLRLIR